MKLIVVLFTLFEMVQTTAQLAFAFLLLLTLLVVAGVFVRQLLRPMGVK